MILARNNDGLNPSLNQRVIRDSIVLALLLLAAGSLVVSIQWFATSSWDWTRPGAAALLCWLGAVIGDLLAILLGQHNQPGNKFLIGMLPRAGIPLAGALLVFQSAAAPDRNFALLLVVMYLISVVHEALTSIRETRNANAGGRTANRGGTNHG
jgi:hypothetical protein